MNAWNRIRTLGLAATVTLAAQGPLSAADMHAIFVIDTNDSNIGTMVAKDLGIMGREVQAIAQAAGLTLKDRVYAGGDFTIENVKSAVQSAKPGPDDVMFFYYSGHGFRTQPKQSRWPYLYFHSERTIDFGWVAETLRSKGARLTISLVDACNNVVNVQVREEQSGAAKAAQGYQELFLRSKGFVTGASSIPGETSIATANGSLFTLSWLKALQQEVGQSSPSWDNIMKGAAGKRLAAGSGSQQPFFEMQVARATAAATPPTASTTPPSTGATATPVSPPAPPTATVTPPSTASTPPQTTAPPQTPAAPPPSTTTASPPPPPQPRPGAQPITF